MARFRLVVVHPADRSDNSLASWRGEVKPSAGGPDTWSRLGDPRTPTQTEINVDNVPPGDHDFRIVWTDRFGQETPSDVKSVTVETPTPAPLEAGSFSVERVD